VTAFDITIRASRPSDVPRLAELVVEAFEGITLHHLRERRYGRIGGRSWQEWKSGELVSFAERHPDQILVAEVDGRVVAFCTYQLDRERKIGAIGNNGVDRTFRNRGIATRLCARALEVFRDEGMIAAEVTTGLDEGHAAARRTYEKVGFEPLMRTVRYIRDL